MNAYIQDFAYQMLDHHSGGGGGIGHSDPPVGVPEPIPPHLQHPEKITKAGETYLWIVFGIMTAGFLGFTALSQRVSYRYRTLYVTNTLICGIAAISYFAMATGIGYTYVPSFAHEWSATREVIFARYIDWLLTTPLLLLDLTLLAGLPVGEIILVIAGDVIMIVTGLIAGLHPSHTYRWGFYTFSCVALLYVFWALVGSARSYAFVRGAKVGSLYNQVSLALLVVWSLYPVVWAFCEGTGKWTIDQEVLAFAILDVIAKPVWGAWIIFATPEEGHVILPESLATPFGSSYGALSQEPRSEEA